MNIVLLDDEDEMLSAIRTQQPDYAFYGGLGLSDDGTWRDVMRGVVATSAARPSVGTLNGRRAASFAGAQWLQTALFAQEIAQPYAIVAVHDYGTPGANLFVHDGIGVNNRAAVYYQISTNRLIIRQSSPLYSSFATLAPVVTVATYNGAMSTLVANGALIVSGDPGQTTPLTGLTIGSTYLATDNYFNGPIASLIVVSGTNYAARAAAIANAARRWYRTG